MNEPLVNTRYGFNWCGMVIERMCSQTDRRPKFAVLTVKCPNGDRIEIQVSPRKSRVTHTNKHNERKRQ